MASVVLEQPAVRRFQEPPKFCIFCKTVMEKTDPTRAGVIIKGRPAAIWECPNCGWITFFRR